MTLGCRDNEQLNCGDHVSSGAVESEAGADPQTTLLAWPSPVYAWYVIAMLIVSYTFAICDRAIIGLLVQPMKADLGVTDAQVGLLQGLAFAICYTSFGLVLGFVTDRADRRLLLALSIFVWSAATIAGGFAETFEELFIARIFVGLGEAGVLPITGSLIADYLPPKSRAKAFGLLMLGGTFGSALSIQVGGNVVAIADLVRGFAPPFIAALHDWQIAFLVVGTPGVVVAAAFAMTVREPMRREKAKVAGVMLKPLFSHIIKNKLAYAALLGGAALNVLCIYAQISWGPTFFLRAYGWTPQQTANFLIFSSIIGTTSAPSVGWLMSWLLGKGRSDAPMIVILIHAACLMTLGPLAYISPVIWLSAPFYLLMALTANWSTSAALMGVSQITPNELRGQVTSFYTLLSGLISLSLGAYAVGMLSDRVFTQESGIRYSMGAVYLIAAGLTVALIFVGRRAFRASVERAQAWVEPK